MKFITSIFLSLVALVLITIGCRKHITPSDNPYGLPNATQDGANIFACRINDQNFIAGDDVHHLGAAIINDSLLVQGTSRNTNYFESLLLLVKDSSLKEIVYDIDTTNVTIIMVTDSTCGAVGRQLPTLKAISGTIQLTRVDTTTKILSGLFSCVIPVPSCDTLQITDGRFDIHYSAIP